MTTTSLNPGLFPKHRESRADGNAGFRHLAAITVASLAFGACPAQAQFSYTRTFDNVNLTVPDGSTVGVSDTRPVNLGLSAPLLDVRVSLELTGGFTGDLYVTLLHEGASSVLLNRVGRRAGDDLGYADSGLNLTFSDSAPQGDVHVYRLTLSGDHNTLLGGPLTGTWQPDARTASPGTVLDASLRSGYLASFAGLSPNGNWTLFLADLTPVGESLLKSWSLEVVVVPEPSAVPVAFTLGLLGWVCWGRRERVGMGAD